MRIDVKPLLDAIDRLIAKADDDLEETLAAEGYVGAKKAVKLKNKLEDAIDDALEADAVSFVEAVTEAETVAEFVGNGWGTIKTSEELEDALRTIFRKQFAEMIRQFTYNWIIAENPTLTSFEEKLSNPSVSFIENWSEELARLMNLSTKDTMERLLLKADAKGWSIDELAQAIGDSGIRNHGYRSRRVALTEMLRVQSYAQQESMVQDPLCYKKRWLHVMSGDPRENHMAMHGQEVFKREPFTLTGADGGTYMVMCPRDVGLPAKETINCHCLMEEIRDDNISGMTDEEWERLRDAEIERANAQYELEHGSDRVNNILSMEKEDQIRYFGGKKDGEARLALVQSGVIDTDKKLLQMYHIDDNGKRTLKSLQELANDGIFTVSDARLKHSTVGDFTGLGNPNKPASPANGGMLRNGGHSQRNIKELESRGITYRVEKTYDNGVRIGGVDGHKDRLKAIGTSGQAWFPETWDDEKIRIAGTYAANNPAITLTAQNPNGATRYTKYQEYEGVVVGVMQNENDVIGTVFPDGLQREVTKQNG
ncbi:MAG: EndoU domain-containing protein [Eubacteriales bacterium]|nr:EndoU domain-containing protein [Eubacteriales bacterium]